jgi:hypothetical protein
MAACKGETGGGISRVEFMFGFSISTVIPSCDAGLVGGSWRALQGFLCALKHRPTDLMLVCGANNGADGEGVIW